MPQGTVLMDDLMSMFPFKNYLAMVTMKGSEVQKLFQRMSRRPQVLGGVKFVVKDGEILELLVGGEPIDENRIYNVATIDFLLTGGDGIFSECEFEETLNSDQLVFDFILAYVRDLAAKGQPIAKERDGRVDDLTERKRREE
jgi:2',3'-cyclic-nucleotide 2'-phosphodiesterase (5'-nucleotidase family)